MITKKIFPGRFYDAAFLNEYGKIESLRASRYKSTFSVILIGVEGLDPFDPSGDTRVVEYYKKLVPTVLDALRDCDVVGMVEESRIAAILPETGYFGSLRTVRKLSKDLARRAVDDEDDDDEAPGPSLVLTQATYPRDGKGFGELLVAAATRLAEKKASAWMKLNLGKKLFWEIVADVSAMSLNGGSYSYFEAGVEKPLTEFFIDQVNELIAGEIIRNPQKGGVFYYSAKKITPALPVIKSLNASGSFATKVFLIGETDDSVSKIKNATALPLDDPRLKETLFTFFLNEDTGYALICREGWGGMFSCFHTSDAYLVEGLITKFQSEYSLQEQLG